VIEPSPGQHSGDAGLLPIRPFDQRLGLTLAFAALDDLRDAELTGHALLEMVRGRFGIVAGYEDQNDHDTLRAAPDGGKESVYLRGQSWPNERAYRVGDLWPAALRRGL
jgi:hypothetical protein